MKSKCISITLEQAKEWYYGDSYVLQQLALKAFDREELKRSFRDIKSFKDACDALELDYNALR